jgi:hypothetical protein
MKARQICVKKLPEISDNKHLLVLNNVELLPNMCDNHHHKLLVAVGSDTERGYLSISTM